MTRQSIKGPNKYKLSIISTVLIFIMFLALCIASSPAQETKVKDMKKFFQNHCVKCHGPDGSAVSADGKELKGQDFTDLKWRQDTTDEQMAHRIRTGKFFGLAMPAFKDKLSPEEIQLIITDIIRKAEKGKVIAP